jgi:glycerol-3-phosphate acyltransferase PlsX
MCDVGANVNCRPRHLLQYAVMSCVYARHVCGVGSPRVGLLSIGEEDAKGTQLIKRTRELLRGAAELDFVGNVEGRDLFHGDCDVVVTDGFVGNVALKLMEGLAEGLFQSLMGELARSGVHESPALQRAVHSIREKYDFNEYGGAPLLGVNGICVICHGASQRRGIANAVRVARSIAQARINERITERIAHCQGTVPS